MAEKNKNELPEWLVYDADNELDVTATLKAIPAKLDKTLFFFREVPEWFEAGPDNLDELRNSLTAIDNMPEKERKPLRITRIRHVQRRQVRQMVQWKTAEYRLTQEPTI